MRPMSGTESNHDCRRVLLTRTTFAFALLLPLFSFALTSWAQSTSMILGSVTDTSGAIVPGAKVTVSNPDKGYRRELVTNSAGEYSASAVPIGDYVITAEAQGFEKLVRTGISLTIGQTLRVDLQLKLGQTTQEVTVSGNIAKVETETATISDVVTGSQIENLNLNGRNFVGLMTLVAGAVQDNGMDASHLGHMGTPLISFNGNHFEQSNIEIDGGNNMDESCGGDAVDVTPNLDSIAEFRITTSNYSADKGKHPGAIVEVATKSGTKDFHGTLHEFIRNDHFDANNWFLNRQIAPTGGNAPKQPLKWNLFGYTFGGPVYIPGHYNTDKSKTFFYWSENWARYREGVVINTGAPSLRMRQGDFSECDPVSPNYNAIAASNCTLPVNPATGKQVDIVPIDPNASAILNGFIPLPNNGVVGYLSTPTQPQNYRQEQIRVDQNVSDKTSVFFRFTQDTWGETTVPSLWSAASYDTVETPFYVPAKSIVLHLTHSFKPNLMAEFLMGYADDPHRWYAQAGPSSPAHSIDKPSTWTANNLFPANASNPLLPTVTICGGTPFCVNEDADPLPWFNSNPVKNWKTDVAYTAGKHTMKFGFFLQKYEENESFGTETQGILSFNAGGSVTTGNAMADFFEGRIQQYTEGTLTVNGVSVGGYGKGHWRMTGLEPYIQDDWRVTRKLTLNLGARYYLRVPEHSVDRPTVDSTFVPSLYNPADEALLNASGNLVPDPSSGHVHDFTTFGNGLEECGVGSIAKGCQTAYYHTLGPRFGFAYDPTGTGKTSIRGGYGVYYEIDNSFGSVEGNRGNAPVSLAPSGFNIVGYSDIVPGAISPTSLNAIPYSAKYTQVHQYSFGIQHEFSGNNLLSVNYVGSLGRHLVRARNLNEIAPGAGTMNVPALAGTTGCDVAGNCNVQDVLINNIEPTIFFVPYRGYTTINLQEPAAVFEYNSLQATYRHTFGHGLTYQSVYTWSHNIDNASGTGGTVSSDVDDYDMSRWRATSALNRSQVLVMDYVYDLPFLKNTAHKTLTETFGGWKVSGITSFFTGEPVDFLCGATGFSSGIGGGVRCNSLGALKINKGVDNNPQFGPTPTWFNPAMIGQPLLSQFSANNQAGMFGYMGRDPLTGPGRNNWDIALLKDFQLPWFGSEHSTLQFRLETFNSFNHPQWKTISIGCGGNTPFGQPCSGNANNLGNGDVSSAWAPRIMQLALKYIF